MRISAKADYAVRAAVELAASGESRPVKGEQVAGAQSIPLKFLENILVDLRLAGIVNSRRGPEGGYWLARPAEEITVADVIRAADGRWRAYAARSPRSSRTTARRPAFARCGSRSARACATSSSM